MQSDFILGYLPFWIVTYALALTAWACLGRFMMQVMVPPDSPNYIWRGFVMVTGWVIAIARLLVPSYVNVAFLPLVAMFWLFAARMVFGSVMLSLGFAPRISPTEQG